MAVALQMHPGAAVDGAPVYRVQVSGLNRTPVHRHTTGIHEEDELGDFFRSLGCEVSGVSLLIDRRSSRSRGFGFVDFQDEASLRLALEHDGAEIREGGPKLGIEVARSAVHQVRPDADEGQRTAAAPESQAREPVREGDRKRERQRQCRVDGHLVAELAAEMRRRQELFQGAELWRAAEQPPAGQGLGAPHGTEQQKSGLAEAGRAEAELQMAAMSTALKVSEVRRAQLEQQLAESRAALKASEARCAELEQWFACASMARHAFQVG